MHRSTLAALVVAGIVGITAGTVSAVVGERSQADTPPLGRTTHTGLLYADARVIHDGDREIAYEPQEGTPSRLVRTRDGYLLANATSPQEPSNRLYAVARDGTTTKVADVLDSWDLDESRTRVVGTDLDSGGLFVWDLTGRVLKTTGRPSNAYLDPVWRGDRVLLSGRIGGDKTPLWRLWTWDPSTGEVDLTRLGGMTGWTGSRDGALLAGAVTQEGTSTDEANPCLRVTTAPQGNRGEEWQTCDWRLNDAVGVFSPDGERVVAIPTDSDGFGPGVFAVMSAATGPSDGLTKIQAPDWTTYARWADDTHLLVHSRTSDADDAGAVLTRCDLRGSCTEVARSETGDLVAGESY